MVYSFAPAADGTVSVSLANLTADLDLIILADWGSGCSPDNCIGSGDTGATFWAQAGTTYYIVVDGRNGATGDYDLTLACGSCSPQATLNCPDTVTGRNDDPGSTDALDLYPVCSNRDASGPEYAYSYQSFDTEIVTFTLTGMTADLDLFLIEDPFGGGCAPGGCIAWGDDTITFPTSPGTMYYAVVDGVAGAASGYTLSVQCAPVACQEAGAIACGGSVAGRNDDPAGTDVIDQYPNCDLVWPPRNESGPEVAYRFDSIDASEVTVTLAPASQDLDLFLIEDWGAGCDPDQCILSGDTTLTFNSLPATTYYVVVDGFQGATDSFTLDLACQPAPFCNPTGPIRCGDTMNANNSDAGSTDILDAYDACAPGWDETGPEIAYRFSPRNDRFVTLDLTSLTGDHDVFVIEDYGTGCDVQNCVYSGDTQIQFDAFAGSTYFIVVDGPGGAVGDFSLAMTCL